MISKLQRGRLGGGKTSDSSADCLGLKSGSAKCMAFTSNLTSLDFTVFGCKGVIIIAST